MRAENFAIHEVLIEHKLNSPTITEREHEVYILFSWNDVLFHQAAIQGIWRKLNIAKAQPIAQTFLGRIRAISYQKLG